MQNTAHMDLLIFACFFLELVKVEQPDSYEKDTWQMGETEKIELVPKLKEQGNNEYKAKNYKKASDLYAKALGILEQLMLRYVLSFLDKLFLSSLLF